MSDYDGIVAEFVIQAGGKILELEAGQSLTRGDVSFLREHDNAFSVKVYNSGMWLYYDTFSVEQIENWPDAPF